MAYQFPTQSVLDATPYRGVAYYNSLNEYARPPGWDATQGTQKALGYADMIALGSLPIVLNNIEKTAEPYLDTLDSIDQGYKNLNAYNSYSNTIQLLDPTGNNSRVPTGQNKLAYTLSPGTLVGTALDLGVSAIDPWFGLSRFANTLTFSDENPAGRIPILSHIQEGIDYTTDYINNTSLSQGVRNAVTKATDPLYDYILDTRVGRPLYETATLPMELVESGGNLFRETGEFIDRNLFGGYLPGLANDEDPSTQEWSNPFENFIEALQGIPGSYRTQREKDADNAYESFDTISQNFIDGIVSRGNDFVEIVEGFEEDRLAVINANFDDVIKRDQAVEILANTDYLSSVIDDPQAWVKDPTGYFEARDPGPLKQSELNLDPSNFKIHDELAPSFQETLTANLGAEATERLMGDAYLDPDVLRWFDDDVSIQQAEIFDKDVRPLYYDEGDFAMLNRKFTFTDGELLDLSISNEWDLGEIKDHLTYLEGGLREDVYNQWKAIQNLPEDKITYAHVESLKSLKEDMGSYDARMANWINSDILPAEFNATYNELNELLETSPENMSDAQINRLGQLADKLIGLGGEMEAKYAQDAIDANEAYKEAEKAQAEAVKAKQAKELAEKAKQQKLEAERQLRLAEEARQKAEAQRARSEAAQQARDRAMAERTAELARERAREQANMQREFVVSFGNLTER